MVRPVELFATPWARVFNGQLSDGVAYRAHPSGAGDGGGGPVTRFEHRAPERELSPLLPLPATEGKAAFAVSAAVLDLLGLSPEQAARLDLGDVFRLIREERGVTWKP